jgi:hypothetical protein
VSLFPDRQAGLDVEVGGFVVGQPAPRGGGGNQVAYRVYVTPGTESMLIAGEALGQFQQGRAGGVEAGARAAA